MKKVNLKCDDMANHLRPSGPYSASALRDYAMDTVAYEQELFDLDIRRKAAETDGDFDLASDYVAVAKSLKLGVEKARECVLKEFHEDEILLMQSEFVAERSVLIQEWNERNDAVVEESNSLLQTLKDKHFTERVKLEERRQLLRNEDQFRPPAELLHMQRRITVLATSKDYKAASKQRKDYQKTHKKLVKEYLDRIDVRFKNLFDDLDRRQEKEMKEFEFQFRQLKRSEENAKKKAFETLARQQQSRLNSVVSKHRREARNASQELPASVSHIPVKLHVSPYLFGTGTRKKEKTTTPRHISPTRTTLSPARTTLSPARVSPARVSPSRPSSSPVRPDRYPTHLDPVARLPSPPRGMTLERLQEQRLHNEDRIRELDSKIAELTEKFSIGLSRANDSVLSTPKKSQSPNRSSKYAWV